MKNLIVLMYIFLGNVVIGQSGWNNVTPSSSYPGLTGVYAIDSNNIWVVGLEGTILHTTDGGTSWIDVVSPVTYDLYNVHFINADTGWIGGDNDNYTEVLRTTDGGSTWEVQSLDNSYGWGNYDMVFINGVLGQPYRGFVSAGLSLVWRTDDYGENWLPTSIGGCGAGNLESICFIDKDEGWFVGAPSALSEVSIVHTTDGGQSYEIQTNPTDPDIKLNGVCFASNQHGIAVGLNGTILFTSDGGNNWEVRPYDNSRWQSVFHRESGRAWAVGQYGNVAYSTDWGYTWSDQVTNMSQELWKVYFLNDNEGWIVGGGIGMPGIILHTTTGGAVTDVDENGSSNINSYSLEQNYPNPFNPSTVISYQLPVSGNVTLKIYDVLGNEITTLVDEYKPAGKYEVEFNTHSDECQNLSSGVYFFQLKAENYIETKKMILLK